MQSFSYNEKTAGALLPARPANSNKGTFGRVTVIGGRTGMCGAAFFSAKAAYRSGAGLVSAIVPDENRIIMQTLLPEAVLSTYNPASWSPDVITSNLEKSSASVIGVGLGTDPTALDLLSLTLRSVKTPLVVDADALNLLAQYPYLFDLINENNPVVITPHIGEMSRLTHRSIKEISDAPAETAANFARTHKVICVLKSHETVVFNGLRNDGYYYLNTTGNSGMATGGSGDVLTGIIAALISGGCPAYTAASLGVYIHGLAGNLASEELGEYSVIASDIISHIPSAFRKLICI